MRSRDYICFYPRRVFFFLLKKTLVLNVRRAVRENKRHQKITERSSPYPKARIFVAVKASVIQKRSFTGDTRKKLRVIDARDGRIERPKVHRADFENGIRYD